MARAHRAGGIPEVPGAQAECVTHPMNKATCSRQGDAKSSWNRQMTS